MADKIIPHFADEVRGVSAADGTSKAKIERAALWLFSEHGIDGVSTKSIAAQAGLSEGLIYRYFKNKEDLARGLMLAIHNRLTQMIKEAGKSEENLPAQIHHITRRYCEIADEDWTLFRYHILHISRFPGLSEKPNQSPLGAAAGLLKKAMKRGEISKVNPDILAAMALGVVLQPAQSKVLGAVSGPLCARAALFEKGVLAVLGLRSETD